MFNGAATLRHKTNMLEQALNNWAAWGLASKPILVHTFTQGQNHHTGLINVGSQSFVLKIFRHSFVQTMNTERWTNQQHLSPTVFYAQDNIQVLEYIDDQGYDVSKLDDLANTINTLHTATITKQRRFDLISFTDEYLIGADQQTRTWHQQLQPLLNEFINDPTPWVFCHNDLVKENCLFDQDGSVYLIDWEFAQRHNPWFDLAAIVLYFELSDEQTKSFLEAYKDGWSTKISERIFYSSQVALLWTDLLWNMHKSGVNYRHKNPRHFNKLHFLAKKLNINLTINT